jgi:hypothetical protein
MFQFEIRSSYDLIPDYDYYRLGIDHAIRKAGGGIDVDEVMQAIHRDEVYVYDIIEERSLMGFVVLAETTQRYADLTTLHVDFAFLMNPGQGVQKLYESLPQFAKELGFDRIAFRSKRKGWAKFCEVTGFDGDTRVYYKELTDGNG